MKHRLWLFQLWKLLQTIKLKSKALQFATANSRTSNLRWSEALRWNNVSSHWLTWSKRQILSMAICILFHNQVDKVYGLWSVHPERESHKVCVPYWIDFYRCPFFLTPNCNFPRIWHVQFIYHHIFRNQIINLQFERLFPGGLFHLKLTQKWSCETWLE